MKSLQDGYRTAEEKETYVENLFSLIENHYDKMNRLMSFGLDQGWRRKAMRLANYKKGSLIMDVAAGTGDFSLAALKVQPEVKIIALDFCRPLLLRAKQKFAHSIRHHPLALIEANGLSMPIKNGTCAGLITAFSLRNVADVEKFFSEFYRLAKPGGKVVSLEMMKPDTLILKLIFAIYFKRIIPLLGSLLSKFPDAYTYLPLSIENFYTAKQLTSIMIKTGWRNVRCNKIMFGFVAVHIGEK